MARKTTGSTLRVRDHMIQAAREEYAQSRRSKADWAHYVAKADFARSYVTI